MLWFNMHVCVLTRVSSLWVFAVAQLKAKVEALQKSLADERAAEAERVRLWEERRQAAERERIAQVGGSGRGSCVGKEVQRSDSRNQFFGPLLTAVVCPLMLYVSVQEAERKRQEEERERERQERERLRIEQEKERARLEEVRCCF